LGSEEELETIRIVKITRVRLYTSRVKAGLPIFDEDVAATRGVSDQTEGDSEESRRVMWFVDARNRVRARLQSDGDGSVMIFYDEKGVEQETIRGLLQVFDTLLRMLGDPEYHPEIVGAPLPLPTLPARTSRRSRRSI
jgi:hypothetical protein